MAFDALRAQGYNIQITYFDGSALPSVALEQGSLDFAGLSNATAWAAVQQGASYVTLMDDAVNTSLLLSRADIGECAELDGQHVSLGTGSALNSTLLQQYIDRNCPGTQPELVAVAGSSTRLADLLAGEVDAAVVDLSDWAGIEANRQAEVRTLVVFADENPGLTLQSGIGRREWVEEQPEEAEDVIRAVLEARRKLQSSQVLADEIVRYLELDEATARQTAKIFLEHDIWDVNGGYDLARVQVNIDFLVEAGELKPGLTAGEVADLTLLDAIRDEIGQQ